MEHESQLVGRESELEYLMARVTELLSDHGNLLLISGEAGSGKTRLCEELEKRAVRGGCSVLVGRCLPSSQSPYLPFMEAFASVVPNPFVCDEELRNEKQSALMLSILDSLGRLSKEKPVIIRLDDLQWSDSASIAMILFLARTIKSHRVLIIGTYRPEDIHVIASGYVHPLWQVIRTMRSESLCIELDLAPLDANETKRLVPSLLGGQADPDLEDMIAKESNGNPLFALEMIKLLSITNQIIDQDGIWTLKLDRSEHMPSTIREVVLARTDRLSKSQKRILQYASAIGEWFEPAIVEEGLGLDHTYLFVELRSLEDSHGLVVEKEGRFKFAHEKIRQVVYEQISINRKKEVHKAIGYILERRLPNEELLGQLSYHFDKADDNEKCIIYSLGAGKYCLGRRAISEAKSYFLLVVSRGENDGRFEGQVLESLEGLGDLKSDASDPWDWYGFYERYLRISHDGKSRARVLAKAAECWDQVSLGDNKKATELLDSAEALAENDPNILAVVEYRRAELSCNDGRLNDALVHIAKAKRCYEDLGDPIGGLRCSVVEITALHLERRYIEERRIALELLPIARDSGDPELLLAVELQLGLVTAMTGDTELTLRFMSRAIDLANKLGMRRSNRLALMARAQAHELEGRFDLAKKDILDALTSAKKSGAPPDIAICEIELGRYEAELGNYESGDRHLSAAMDIVSNFDLWLRFQLETNLMFLKALLLEARAAFDQSDRLYQEFIENNTESNLSYELLNCRCRYALSLSKRGKWSEAEHQLGMAYALSIPAGCDGRVRAFAKMAGIGI